jgi:hypothetical protein
MLANASTVERQLLMRGWNCSSFAAFARMRVCALQGQRLGEIPDDDL